MICKLHAYVIENDKTIIYKYNTLYYQACQYTHLTSYKFIAD